MNRLLLAAGFAALAACSSPGKLKEEAPALRLDSRKSPSVYMTCLLPQWQSYRASATVAEVRFGYRLLMPDASGRETEALLEVTAAGQGSDVALYRRAAPIPDDAIVRAARACL